MKLPTLCVVFGSAVGGIKVATGIVPNGSDHNRPQVEEKQEKCESHPDRGIALIQGLRRVSKQNMAHIWEEKVALLDKSNDTHSRGSVVLGPVKPPSKDGIIDILGITRDNLCLARGDNAGVGCAVGCLCGWYQQCYPKTMLVVLSRQRSNSASQDATSRVQVGICDLTLSVLVLLSVFILLGAICCFGVAQFVAKLPGHYGLGPTHREVHKPQRGQVEEQMGGLILRPPVGDLRSFQLQKEQERQLQRQPQQQRQGECEDDTTDDTQAMQPVSSRALIAESPVSQTDTVPVIPNIIITKPGAFNDEPVSGAA